MNSIQSCEVTSGQAESGFSSREHKNRTVAMKTDEQVFINRLPLGMA